MVEIVVDNPEDCEGCCVINDCDQWKACFDFISEFTSVDADLEVTFSGATDGTCTNCADVNDTYIISGPLDFNDTGGRCTLDGTESYDDFSPCGVATTPTVQVNLGYIPGLGSWVVGVGGPLIGTPSATYRLTGAAAESALATLCAGGSVVVPYLSGGGTACNWTGATATVTILFP